MYWGITITSSPIIIAFTLRHIWSTYVNHMICFMRDKIKMGSICKSFLTNHMIHMWFTYDLHIVPLLYDSHMKIYVCSMLVLYENHIKGASYVNYMKHTYIFIKRNIDTCEHRKKGIWALDKIYLCKGSL